MARDRDLFPVDVFRDLIDVRDTFDRFFSNIFPAKRTSPASVWVPAIEMYDKKDKIIVKAEVPGVDKKDIKLTVEDDVLTISGETKREEETKESDYYSCERVYGAFSRSIALPTAADREKVKATLKDGILTVELPKLKGAQEKAKEIPID